MRRFCFVLAVAALVCGGSTQAAEPAALPVVRDPHYGDTLFTFFQDQYFQSITGLMVSQHFGRVAHHTEEAEVLRGGMLLSYGMQREAGEIFERMTALGVSAATQDRAWFFLAKIRYQRGYLEQAQAALARIGNSLEPQLQEERGLLQAQLSMATGDYAAAAQRLAAMDQKAVGARYVRFNLGVALIKSGQGGRGTEVLNALGLAPAENEEYRDLRDRANLALGFAALAAQQWPEARQYLERVRLKSLQANKALLGLGWTASAQKQSRLALVPWLELVQREVSDPAVLEAFVAAPYAYAELGAYGQAASGYEQAIATFAQETAALDSSIAALRTGALVQALVDSNPGRDMGWFWGVKSLPDMPHASHLSAVLARHDFQEALKNYRDLLYLERNLQDWSDKLGTLDDMLANRQKAFAERLPGIARRAQASSQAAEPLHLRQQALAAMLAEGQAAADGVAFANAHEQDLLVRVQRLQAVADTAPRNAERADSADVAERVRLAAGVLHWNLAQDYPVRQWQAQRALQSVDSGLAEVQRLDAALLQAAHDEPLRFAAFSARIAALSPALAAQLQRVASLRQTQQQALQDLAIEDLQRQQQAIAGYATQARFALAQLYDRSSVSGAGKEADHAAKP